LAMPVAAIMLDRSYFAVPSILLAPVRVVGLGVRL
jgi:hypothetical protein